MGACAAAKNLVLLSIPETPLISGIEWFVYETGLRGLNNEPDRRCAVRIAAEPGIHGWADVPTWMMPDIGTAHTIRDRLVGHELVLPHAIWRDFYESNLPLGTLGAIDIALWDLLGRIENKPVHALLGTRRQEARAYVTTATNLGAPEQYVEYALACREAGVHGCKIRPYIEPGIGATGLPGIGFPDRDMAVYQAVREAVGMEFACMADNSRTYTLDEALRVGKLLDNLRYEWYESPMPETDAWQDRYIALVKEIKTPVCAPEAHPDSHPARVLWLASGACNISRMDVHLGGFTPCLELALVCESFGASLELRNVGLESYPHLQLIAATSESVIKYVEVSSLSQTTRVHPGRAAPEPVLDDQGCVSIPQTPGMGLELDWNYIYRHRVH